MVVDTGSALSASYKILQKFLLMVGALRTAAWEFVRREGR